MLTTVSSRNRIDGYAGCGCGVGCGVGSVECAEPEFALLAEGTCFVSEDDELVVAAPGEAPPLPGPGPGPGAASLVVVIRGGGTRNESTGEAGDRPIRPNEGDAVERVRNEAGREESGCTR